MAHLLLLSSVPPTHLPGIKLSSPRPARSHNHRTTTAPTARSESKARGEERSGGMANMAAAAEGKSRRFALACGVLSQYVKAEQKMSAAPVTTTLSLMPGADVAAQEEAEARKEEAQAGPAPAPLTIFYGGRVVVFENFPADKAAEVMRMAAGAERAAAAVAVPAPAPRDGPVLADLPILSKASVQRFFEKRKDRLGARAPYARQAPETKESDEKASSSTWLGLGGQDGRCDLGSI